jgi:hypothetical protein
MEMANTALVQTKQRLLVSVQGYLLPHNFTVSLPSLVGRGARTKILVGLQRLPRKLLAKQLLNSRLV